MPVVTLFTHGKDQTGNTVSAILLATFLGLTKNKKTLLLSTGFRDRTVRESFWPIVEKKKSFFTGNTNTASANIFQSGIDDLDRMVTSNRLSPDIIKNYTRVALRERLEIIDSYMGSPEQYEKMQNSYPKITMVAKQYYDYVIVDIDKRLSSKVKMDILNISDIVLAMSVQKLNNIKELQALIQNGKILKNEKTLITLGRYDKNMKYNAKNLSRSVLKQRQIIDTIPYNFKVAEAIQEGRIIDIIFGIINLKNADENFFLAQELQRLADSIDSKFLQLEMRR